MAKTGGYCAGDAGTQNRRSAIEKSPRRAQRQTGGQRNGSEGKILLPVRGVGRERITVSIAPIDFCPQVAAKTCRIADLFPCV